MYEFKVIRATGFSILIIVILTVYLKIFAPEVLKKMDNVVETNFGMKFGTEEDGNAKVDEAEKSNQTIINNVNIYGGENEIYINK